LVSDFNALFAFFAEVALAFGFAFAVTFFATVLALPARGFFAVAFFAVAFLLVAFLVAMIFSPFGFIISHPC